MRQSEAIVSVRLGARDDLSTPNGTWMFSLTFRVLLFVAAIGYGSFQIAHGRLFGCLPLCGAAVLVIGYFRYGAIRPAFKAMLRHDLAAAGRYLATIRFPGLLGAQSRAYYHWINAVVLAQEVGSLQAAEEEMRRAVGGALRTSNDRCVATATLAQIMAIRGDRSGAMRILADAEKIAHGPAAADYLQEMKMEFAKTTAGDL